MKILITMVLLLGSLSLVGFAKADLGSVIPGQYIVVYNDATESAVATPQLSSRLSFTPRQVYGRALNGFSAQLRDDQVTRLRADPAVAMVVPDRIVTIAGRSSVPARSVLPPITTPTSAPKKVSPQPYPQPPAPTPTPTQAPVLPSAPTVATTVKSLPTGINRIGINSTNFGEGIGVAILDTGIDLTHPDLRTSIIATQACSPSSLYAQDDNGHGTHVAGIVAAQNNGNGVKGVASKANLIAVKIFDSTGSGSWSSIICGIEYITSVAGKYNIKVANLSLGASGISDNACGTQNNDPFHIAICRSVASTGIIYVAAAGNSASDSRYTVPGAYDDTLITVAALVDTDGKLYGQGPATQYGFDDRFASFSGFGKSVDLAAPGVSIYSTWKNGGYAKMSGTSMAAPHVSGCVALYLKSHPLASWAAVRDALRQVAEPAGAGHTDQSGLHPEPVVRCGSL